jgi:hypothetical protein
MRRGASPSSHRACPRVAPSLARIGVARAVLVLCMVLVASGMARGVGTSP